MNAVLYYMTTAGEKLCRFHHLFSFGEIKKKKKLVCNTKKMLFYESVSVSPCHSSSEGDFRVEGRKAQVVVIENLWKDKAGSAVRSQRSSQA